MYISGPNPMFRLMTFTILFIVAVNSAMAEQKVLGAAVKQAFNSYYNYELLRLISVKCQREDYLEEVNSQSLERELLRVTKLNLAQFYDYLLTVSYNIEMLHKQMNSFNCNNSKHLNQLGALAQQHLNALKILAESNPLPESLSKLNYSVGKSKSLRARQIQAAINSASKEAHTIAVATLVRTINVPDSHKKVYFMQKTDAEFVYRMDRGWKNKIDHYLPVSNSAYLYEQNENQYFVLFIHSPKNLFKTYEIFQAFTLDEISQHLFLLGQQEWNW